MQQFQFQVFEILKLERYVYSRRITDPLLSKFGGWRSSLYAYKQYAQYLEFWAGFNDLFLVNELFMRTAQVCL